MLFCYSTHFPHAAHARSRGGLERVLERDKHVRSRQTKSVNDMRWCMVFIYGDSLILFPKKFVNSWLFMCWTTFLCLKDFAAIFFARVSFWMCRRKVKFISYRVYRQTCPRVCAKISWNADTSKWNFLVNNVKWHIK